MSFKAIVIFSDNNWNNVIDSKYTVQFAFYFYNLISDDAYDSS